MNDTMSLPRPPESCSVSTPAAVARAMVSALGDRNEDRWLDPCVGGGAFLRALSDIGVPPDRVTAVDIDQTQFPSDVLARTTRGLDFLAWARTTDKRFDKIIANPPYVALSRLPEPLRKSALNVSARSRGSLRSKSNYWPAFMHASLSLLQVGGSISFVLPAAWDYAKYAAQLRDEMPLEFSSFEVHRSRKPIFHPIQDGCIVVVGRGFRQGRSSKVTRFEYDTPEALARGLALEKHGRSETAPVLRLHNIGATKGRTCRLGDVISVRLGGVTGDASYFLMTEEERNARKLPLGSVRPVLSKARHLVSGEVSVREWRQLLDKGERIWLFDPPHRLCTHASVRSYIDLASGSGGCKRDRYKIRIRDPWYRTPLPYGPHGFLSGMSRLGPWICLRGMDRLTATNTLYTIRFRRLLTRDEQFSWALALITSRVRADLSSLGRVYPDGLLKYEPGDLQDILLPIPTRTAGAAELYCRAISVLLHGDPLASQQMADCWFSECDPSASLVSS